MRVLSSCNSPIYCAKVARRFWNAHALADLAVFLRLGGPKHTKVAEVFRGARVEATRIAIGLPTVLSKGKPRCWTTKQQAPRSVPTKPLSTVPSQVCGAGQPQCDSGAKLCKMFIVYTICWEPWHVIWTAVRLWCRPCSSYMLLSKPSLCASVHIQVISI